MNSKTKGSLIAAAVAGLFIGGACSQTAKQSVAVETGYCLEKSSCAGKGECAAQMGMPGEPSDKHDCAGKNSCGGKGWIYKKKEGQKMLMTKEECEKNKDSVYKKKES